MGNSYVLSCCSTADLSKEYLEQRDIHYICFHLQIDGKEYMDDLGQSIPFPDFYKALVAGAASKTSQVNADEYLTYFRSFLERGLDVLHLCLSSGISGTYNSAQLAAKTLQEEFPFRKVYIVDSLGASSGYGLLMDKLADMRDEGKTIDEVWNFALANRLNLNHWFFSTDLSFYVKGGRISRSAYVLGSALGICPLLNMDSEGKLIPQDRIRTKNKVIRTIVQKMVENAKGGLEYNEKCFISQSACLEDAQAVADLVEKTFPKLNGKVMINDIGTVIGTHTGPGTVALFFWGRERA
ncbi:MAG: DegV family protein [Blautia sp.]|nr:DegV family protein [Blautia sp.]